MRDGLTLSLLFMGASLSPLPPHTAKQDTVCLLLNRNLYLFVAQMWVLGGLNNRHFVKSKIKASTGFVRRPRSLACRWPGHLFPWSPLSLWVVRVLIFAEGHQPDGIRPILMASSKCRHLFEGPISKYSLILRYRGLGFQRMTFWIIRFSSS